MTLTTRKPWSCPNSRHPNKSTVASKIVKVASIKKSDAQMSGSYRSSQQYASQYRLAQRTSQQKSQSQSGSTIESPQQSFLSQRRQDSMSQPRAHLSHSQSYSQKAKAGYSIGNTESRFSNISSQHERKNGSPFTQQTRETSQKRLSFEQKPIVFHSQPSRSSSRMIPSQGSQENEAILKKLNLLEQMILDIEQSSQARHKEILSQLSIANVQQNSNRTSIEYPTFNHWVLEQD